MLHRPRYFMAPEDIATATGASPTPTATVETTPAPGTAAPVPTAATAADIAAIVAAQVKASQDSIFAELRRSGALKPAATATPAPKPDAAPAANGAGQDVHAILAKRDAFDDAVGDLPLKAPQKAMLREFAMRDAAGADDMAAYVAKFVERAGWSTAPATVTPPANGAPAPVVTPAAGNGMPATTPPARVVTSDTNIFAMSAADQAAAIAGKTPFEVKARMDKDAAAARFKLR